MKKIELEVFAMGGNEVGCAGGKCPTIYKSNDGRFFVQGYVVQDSIKQLLDLPENETLIEIDNVLIERISKKTKSK